MKNLSYDDGIKISSLEEGVIRIIGKMSDGTRTTIFLQSHNPSALANLREMIMVFGCRCYEEGKADVKP